MITAPTAIAPAAAHSHRRDGSRCGGTPTGSGARRWPICAGAPGTAGASGTPAATLFAGGFDGGVSSWAKLSNFSVGTNGRSPGFNASPHSGQYSPAPAYHSTSSPERAMEQASTLPHVAARGRSCGACCGSLDATDSSAAGASKASATSCPFRCSIAVEIRSGARPAALQVNFRGSNDIFRLRYTQVGIGKAGKATPRLVNMPSGNASVLRCGRRRRERRAGPAKSHFSRAANAVRAVRRTSFVTGRIAYESKAPFDAAARRILFRGEP